MKSTIWKGDWAPQKNSKHTAREESSFGSGAAGQDVFLPISEEMPSERELASWFGSADRAIQIRTGVI